MSTEERLDQILTQLNGIGKRLDTIDTRLAALNTRLDHIDTRLDTIDNHLKSIDRFLLDFRNEVTNRLDIIDGRLATQAALYQTLEPRLSVFTKAALDFGAIATRLQTEQSRIARLVEPAA